MPTVHGPFRCIVYHVTGEPNAHLGPTQEHMAIVRGSVKGKGQVLTRVHSECWTSEVMGSLKCDCREQFHSAMDRIAAEGTGVLVYLRQEGRGIGLGNKITPEPGSGEARWAELAKRLGDCRALIAQGVGPNPRKVLEESGLQVVEAEGLIEDALGPLFQNRPLPASMAKRSAGCGSECGGTGQGCG